MLVDLERVGYLPNVCLAPEEVRELRRLVRYRQQLRGDRRNLKLRNGALFRNQRVRFDRARPWGTTLAGLASEYPDDEPSRPLDHRTQTQ